MPDTIAYKEIHYAVNVYSYSDFSTPNYTVTINNVTIGTYVGCNSGCGNACAEKNYQWYRGSAYSGGISWNARTLNNFSMLAPFGGANNLTISTGGLTCATGRYWGMGMEVWYKLVNGGNGQVVKDWTFHMLSFSDTLRGTGGLSKSFTTPYPC